MKKIKHQIRQGDVLVTPCDSLPSTAVKQPKSSKIVVAYGEVTGHHHAVECDQADYWKDTASSDQYVQVARAGTMTHEDHKPPLPLPATKKSRRVILQRQFSTELSKRVED